MTLYTSDYLEYYLTLISWVISNGIWHMLVASGLFALPFITIIIQEWLKARAEGADEGNKGALSAIRIENRIWVAVVVIMFAGIPFMQIDFESLKYDDTRSKQCQTMVPKPPEDTPWGVAFSSINGQSAKVPVWWAFIHTVSRAITGSAIASIPCGIDLRQMRMEIDSARIADPLLAQEVADFTRDCYGHARSQLFMSRPELDKSVLDDINWIGSTYFVNTAGFYDSYRSQSARVQWPYNETRDAGLAQVMHGGGYPNCKAWWSDSGVGLRARLLHQVSPSLLSRFGGWIGYLSQDEVNDQVVRTLVTPEKQIMNRGWMYSDYGGQIDKSLMDGASRLGTDFGITVGSLAYFPAMDAIRYALPMVLAFLKMTIVICIPLLIVVGLYELKHVVTVSCIQFALFFVDFWFSLARWIDSTILDALYSGSGPHSNLNPWIGMNNGTGDNLLNFVMGSLFIVLPVIWVSALGWVGINAGRLIMTLAEGTNGAARAASKSGEYAEQAAKTAIMKKMK